MFLKISQNSLENSSVKVSFLTKFQTEACKFSLAQIFAVNFAKFVRTPFYRTLPLTASEYLFFQNTFNGCFFSFIKFHWLMHTISILFKLLNAIAKFRQINCRIERIQTWGSAIFCKFLVGNSASTEASELRNIDITEFRCLDFSNVNLKFLTLRSLKSSWQSRQNEKTCQKESMEKICLVLASKRNHPKKYQVSKRFFIRTSLYKLVSCN